MTQIAGQILYQMHIVKRGPQQVDINFPLNAARRRFPSFHYRRVINNGEIVPRSSLIYSQETDKAVFFVANSLAILKVHFVPEVMVIIVLLIALSMYRTSIMFLRFVRVRCYATTSPAFACYVSIILSNFVLSMFH